MQHAHKQAESSHRIAFPQFFFLFCFVFIYIDSSFETRGGGGDHMLSLRGQRLKINRVKSSARESDYGPVWAGRCIVLPRSPVYLPSRRLVCLFWLFSFPLPISRVTLARRPRPEERACVPPIPPTPANPTPPSVSINISFPG